MMPKGPSSFLNALTILSIIGSIFGLLSAPYSFFTAEKNYNNIKQVISSGSLDGAPAFVKGMVNEKTLEMSRLMLENKWPMMIITILGSLLCLYGALEMRKLKSQGYFLWLTGELIPIAGLLFFIGSTPFSGFSALGYLFPLAFIIFYTLHRKELNNG